MYFIHLYLITIKESQGGEYEKEFTSNSGKRVS